jgi:multicomponent Na+:H+ antiporter subunit E
MVIAGSDRADVLPGIGAALLAGWASLRLMPPDPAGGRVRWFAALGLLGRFAGISVRAGIDVALRALAPRLRLDPGFAPYQSQLPPSDALDLFKAMTSQMPGTIPAGSEPSGAVAYHCLDISLPVLRELSEEEAILRGVLGGALGSAGTAGSRRDDA